MTHWLYHGDCLDVLRRFPDCSIDAVVTDGPYELGYMARAWDKTDIVFKAELWREVLRVVKPGAHLLSFGGTRTYHRMACAVEDAGFDIRDSLHWFYFSGFPKSQDAAREWDMHVCTLLGRHCDKNYPKKRREDDHLCPEAPGREPFVGKRTALRPAHEPVVLARKPLDGTTIENLLAHGTGTLNIDDVRLDCGRWPLNIILDEHAAAELDSTTSHLRAGGTLKGGEGQERSVVSPLSLGPRGPWASYGDSGGASRFVYVPKPGRKERDLGCQYLPLRSAADLTNREPDTDGLRSPRAGAGRTSKGTANSHPTVKPIALMEYLCKLVTPAGGVVLDPFTGSGSTGVGAVRAGFRFVGIEKELEYIAIANARIHAAFTHEVEDDEEDPDHPAAA